MAWISGDTLDSNTLNVRGGSATALSGFSTNTLGAQSGNTVSLGTFTLSAGFYSLSTLSASQTTTSMVTQGILYFSVLSLTSNGAEIGLRSGNTVYRFPSVSVG